MITRSATEKNKKRNRKRSSSELNLPEYREPVEWAEKAMIVFEEQITKWHGYKHSYYPYNIINYYSPNLN